MGMLIRRHRPGFDEKTATPEAPKAEQAETPAPPSEAPAKNAAHDVWIAYAESRGIEDAASKTRNQLIELTEELDK